MMTKKKTTTRPSPRAKKAAAKRTSAKTTPAPLRDQAAEVFAVVRAIPRGKVATYGDVAELAGLPSGHRFVARCMRVCPNGLPWQRVVGRHDARRAHISIGDPEHAALQRALLIKERVVFDASGLIVMRKSGWLPR